MAGLFWTPIAIMILYRVYSICIGFWTSGNDSKIGDEWKCALFGCCLGLLDMYIIKVVHDALQKYAKEPTPRQKIVHTAFHAAVHLT